MEMTAMRRNLRFARKLATSTYSERSHKSKPGESSPADMKKGGYRLP
jgi:hypothetical protein